MEEFQNKILSNRYKLIKKIGSGGLGIVFKALDRKTNEEVAVKFLHEKYTKNKKFLGIFHKELLINSELNHKNIAMYLDNYFNPPNCYIVTEYIEGWSGYVLTKKFKKFPPLVALSIIFDLLQGVDHIHLHDTTHSDLSTANFMINTEGRVKITDFGLSIKFQVEDYKHYVIGTPGYYSPEHISENPISVRSDIYCAALLLYELITGQKAVVASSNHTEVEKDMKNINFSKVTVADKKMQEKIQKLLKDCLQYEPSKRLPNIEKMLYRFYEILRTYKIKYTRLAITQFLKDRGMMDREVTKEQNIYFGS